ncbi:sensor histidine kinase [Streptomyces sp. NPDC003691]
MRERTLWQAVADPHYLRSGWPWRGALYVLTGALLGALVLVGLVLAAAIAGAGALAVVGLPLLVGLGLVGLPVGYAERGRLAILGGAPLPGPHREPDAPGLWAWVRTRYREAATWRELGYALLFAGLLWPLDALVVLAALGVPAALAAVPVLMATTGGGAQAPVLKEWTVTSWPVAFAVAALGVLLLAAGLYAIGVYAAVRAEPVRLLLSRREARNGELGVRVAELTSSRARLVAAFEAERRRIERDLHDGAQQRLVALTMTLGLARLDAPPGPLAGQLATAHQEAGLVLAELRELIHGIHPKVLTDYGLPAAVADAADRAAVPVDVALELPGRLPQPVESAGYFVVCEALANVDKHSGAERAVVSGGYLPDRLWLEICDNGRGGADPAVRAVGGGTGLTGLADRVAVLDGTLSVSSPPGGPTLLRVEIPCEWTDPSV